jgi:transposase
VIDFHRGRSLGGWCDEVIGRLLPHLDGVKVNEVAQTSVGVVLHAAARSAEQSCPACSVASGRVHSRYQRRLADLPIAGRLVELCLTVRRFFCVNTVCGMRTFGGYGIVRDFVEQHRTRPDLRAIPKPLSTRQVAGWICRHPDNLADRDTTRLATILDTWPRNYEPPSSWCVPSPRS